MVDYIFSLILYICGCLFILTVFEPAEETPERNLLILALVWPLYTMVLVYQEIFYKEEE